LRLCVCIAVLFPVFLAVGSILEMTPPISGLALADLWDTFEEVHNGHRHEAIDILEPRGTPVHAVVSGTIRKLFLSNRGGNTIYQFDEMGVYCYYYAHLDRYVEGLREGNAGRAWGHHRVCGIDGKCGCAHAALAFCDLRVGAGKTVVEGEGR
jgi:hypothetical protein